MKRAAAGLLVLSAVLGCRSLPTPPASSRASVTPVESAVQVVHRRARSASGQLHSTALGSLADAAVATVAPGQLPFDGWASLATSEERAVLVAAPRPGPLAREIVRRWQAALPDQEVKQFGWEGAPSEPVGNAAIVLVVAPAWTGGSAAPDPSEIVAVLRRAGWPAPRLIVVDLLEPVIGSDAWSADMIVAGSDPARLGLAMEYILSARARGAVPDLFDLARRRGIGESEASWTVYALVD